MGILNKTKTSASSFSLKSLNHCYLGTTAGNHKTVLHHFGWKHMAFKWDICSCSPATLTTKLGLWLEAFSTVWAIGINKKKKSHLYTKSQ